MPSPVFGPDTEIPLDSIPHVIHVALTLVFLLSGVGTLPTVFNTRRARVTDHVAELLESASEQRELARLRAHIRRLQRHTTALDAPVALMAIGGAASCGAAFALLAPWNATVASALVLLFGTPPCSVRWPH